jgi:hypothetical protein
MHIQYFLRGGVVQDLFYETIAVQRIGVLKLAVHSDCSCDEKDMIFSWLIELSADLGKNTCL